MTPNILKINDLLDENRAQLTHILELISDDLPFADFSTHCFLIDINQEIGAFIETILDRQKDFDDECADPELGDQGAIMREIGKTERNAVREYVKSDIKNTTGLLYGDSIR